jgi:hypothetical protein
MSRPARIRDRPAAGLAGHTSLTRRTVLPAARRPTGRAPDAYFVLSFTSCFIASTVWWTSS